LDFRESTLTIFKEKDFVERRNAANEARKALLERFKARPSADDPAVIMRMEERRRIIEARALREAEKERQRQERLARERAEAEARRIAEEAARKEAEEKARIEAAQREAEEQVKLEAELALEEARKAKRDARYAARKARNGRLPPSR
jgi:hypothetical protein